MFKILEMEKGEVKLSPAMSEIVKTVQQSKWTLMRTRQQLSRGYKEVLYLFLKYYVCIGNDFYSMEFFINIEAIYIMSN